MEDEGECVTILQPLNWFGSDQQWMKPLKVIRRPTDKELTINLRKVGQLDISLPIWCNMIHSTVNLIASLQETAEKEIT